ncbi:hypothetical protein [Streptomyces sennicomposti]|uniref:hypothetical protein n=1 Tax=Streptomyces sennicomposti TaxID=2873384 RepID=UPI001CA6F4D0|nr:hypothetical protein [Streptomyces sennicomposti]MBY8868716.1 hypothetical protein [Streptomyces sennicomposti]
MAVEPIVDLRAALKLAVAELAFEAGWQAAVDPERAERLMTVAFRMEETLKRTSATQP